MSSVLNKQKPAKKQQKKSSLNRKIITGILKSSLVITIVICLLIGFVLTPWGTKTIINTSTSLVDELTIDYRSGGVGSELHLSSVKWKQLTSKVEIDNLRLSIKLSCVLKLALCIDSISTDKIVVQIQPTDPSTNAEPALSAISLPFHVYIDNINLNTFSLEVKDTASMSWQKLTSKLDFYQRLRIEKMQLDGFNNLCYRYITSRYSG
jgi:translocation and assembly module TamB